MVLGDVQSINSGSANPGIGLNETTHKGKAWVIYECSVWASEQSSSENPPQIWDISVM